MVYRQLTPDLKATLQKEAPETLKAPTREQFTTFADFNNAQAAYNTYGNWAQKDTTSNSIPVSTVTANSTPMTVPQPQAPINYNQVTTGVTSPYLEAAQMQQQQASNQLSSDANSIQNLMSSLSGKSAYEAQQAQDLGLNKANQDYITKSAELSALNKQAAAAQQENIAQGRQLGSVASFVAGQGNEIERNRAIRALTIGAELDALQGNIQVAQMKVKQAVDAKYASQETDLANRMKMFEINKGIYDTLSAQEQKQWDRAKYATEQAQKKLDDNKKVEGDINNIRLEIINNGGNPNVVDGVTSVSEAINKAGSLLKKPNTEIIKLGDNSAYLIDKTTGKIIKSFGTGTGTGAGATGVTPNPAVDVILASGKFTKDQATSIRNAINNGENPSVVIKNNAKQLMTGANQTKLENYEATQTAMKGLKDALNAFYAAGGDTGLIKGNFEKVSNRLGEVNDPKLAQLAVEVQSQLQSYRNAISGTAYSDQEGRDIASVFPGINKSKQLNDAIFAGRDRALQGSIDGMYRSVLGDKIYQSLNQVAQSGNVSKGNMKDGDFIEKALNARNIKYEQFINGTQPGEIPVIDNSTGEPVYVTPSEYNPSKYTKA